MTQQHTKPPTNAVPHFPPGWRVFPVKSGTKEPAIKNWASEASDDPLQIEAWQIQFPGCNWGLACGPSGLAVIDVDPPTGEDSLFAFELEHGQLPPTREHRSARGGRHLIYRGDIAQTASKLGPKIDTRGGYILIPPSTFEGKPYVVSEDIPIADLPAFVGKAAGLQHERKHAPPGIELDTPNAKVRAKTLLDGYIKHHHVAIDGQGGDTLTYAVAAEVMALGLSRDAAFEVMQDWNAACQPPWDDDELRVKIENASKYAQNEPGAYAVPPVEQRIPAEVLDGLKAEGKASAPQNEPLPALEEDHYEWRFETFNAAEDAHLPPITYHDENKLWPKIPGGSLTQIIAQAKGYKTTFYLSELFRLVARELKAESE